MNQRDEILIATSTTEKLMNLSDYEEVIIRYKKVNREISIKTSILQHDSETISLDQPAEPIIEIPLTKETKEEKPTNSRRFNGKSPDAITKAKAQKLAFEYMQYRRAAKKRKGKEIVFRLSNEYSVNIQTIYSWMSVITRLLNSKHVPEASTTHIQVAQFIGDKSNAFKKQFAIG